MFELQTGSVLFVTFFQIEGGRIGYDFLFDEGFYIYYSFEVSYNVSRLSSWQELLNFLKYIQYILYKNNVDSMNNYHGQNPVIIN